MTKTTAILTADYLAPVREAAGLVRSYWSADAERERAHITVREQHRAEPLEDNPGVVLTGLGALILGHPLTEARRSAQVLDWDDDLPEQPLDWERGPAEGYTGYHGVPLVALYLAVTNMASAQAYTAATVAEWCRGEDRTAGQVAEMLQEAADTVAGGTLPIGCAACSGPTTFGWGVPLRHVQTAGRTAGELLAEHHRPWLIVHDGQAVCPRSNRTHQEVREDLLVGATAVLLAPTPAQARGPR